ncbi:MAG: hypothetical protein K9N51_03400 [Candidatus Pacebacteria bacterium]|nr:hypothetical protein [Candidatus Paceibacterota bacterium]
MMHVALSVDDVAGEEWFDAIADTRCIRAAEVTLACLTENTEIIERAAVRGIDLACVRDVLSSEESRYFSDIPLRVRQSVARTLGQRLIRCGRAGVRTASVRLGLERITEKEREGEIADRVAFLKNVISPLDSCGLTLCLTVRYPMERPQSREWDLAINIVHDVMHPVLRMGVDVFPSELDGDFDPMAFVRNTGMNLGVLRFVYEPGLGETLAASDLARWNEALRWHGYRGGIVFRPRPGIHTSIREVCAEVDAWAGIIQS